jgi:hypothetical protein
MSAAIDATSQKRCEELCDVSRSIGKAAALLRAAATTLRADGDRGGKDIKLRKIAASLVDEARLILRDPIPDGLESEHPDASEIENDLYRLYSQVLMLASALGSERAIDGDGVCICPEADALELASEFAGIDNGEGLYARIEQIARDVLVAGSRSSKRGTEARR